MTMAAASAAALESSTAASPHVGTLSFASHACAASFGFSLLRATIAATVGAGAGLPVGTTTPLAALLRAVLCAATSGDVGWVSTNLCALCALRCDRSANRETAPSVVDGGFWI